MVDAPEQLLKMVEKANSAHPSSVDDALEFLIQKWGGHPARPAWAEELEIRALRQMLHDNRHKLMVSLRKKYGAYGAASTGLSTGAANAVAEMMLLDHYSINGQPLGSILGKDLPGLANGEFENGKTRMFNAELLRKLSKIVPGDKQVREAVSETRVRKLFRDLGNKAA
jgi:hypothetical protein